MNEPRTGPRGIVVAGTHSGVGKTTITLGLMAALKKRGLRVAPFKVGPDFIDPGHHGVAAGSVSRNLDGWMLSRDYNCACFGRHAGEADLAVVEGVMGLFDGFSGNDETGSTAQMAKWLGLPVVLVVDAAGMARSAAALIQGFERFDPDVNFAGVIFNSLGSPGHLRYLEEAVRRYVKIPCLGGLCREEVFNMPERHLGLVTAEDHPPEALRLDELAARMEACLDLDQMLRRLPEVRLPGGVAGRKADSDGLPVRIGVARDRAFCFYYQDNLDLLVETGAQLVPFSPLTDRCLPESLDGIYLGGGYPELHGAELARNTAMAQAVRSASRHGMPIYGECGGFMYLCRELVDTQGRSHPMTGCFPFRTRMFPRLRALGYREIRLCGQSVIGPRDMTARGHEFHYSDIEPAPDAGAAATCYAMSAGHGREARAEGYCRDRTLGSYVHIHFGSRPEIAASFVESCRRYRDEG